MEYVERVFCFGNGVGVSSFLFFNRIKIAIEMAIIMIEVIMITINLVERVILYSHVWVSFGFKSFVPQLFKSMQVFV